MHDIKKATNKSCLELNFVQKSPRAHMSIFHRVVLGGSKDWYDWNIILYWNGKIHSV